MATQLFSLPQFFGVKYGTADNLIPTGYASEAKNVDVTDGALQTLIGLLPWPDVIEDAGELQHPDPERLWEYEGQWFMIDFYTSHLLRIYYKALDQKMHCEIAHTPTASEQLLLASIKPPFLVTINGELVALLGSASHQPAVVGFTDPENYYVRGFGTGMFLTSDEITSVVLEPDNSISALVISRAMTDDEIARCVYAGVYIMEHEDDELDYIAAYVDSCQVVSDSTTIFLRDALPAGSIAGGSYVKVRGGLSDMPMTMYATFYGRLFAAGNPDFPNRLYWSCLPGDGRTIEDWTADDASPDTGGGYMQIGMDGSEITALFAFDQQLLIWCGDGLYRLYGATPSQYTLERVFVGFKASAADITLVNGVPYVLSDDGVWYYNGSSLQRADSDRTLPAFFRDQYGQKVADYGQGLDSDLNTAYDIDVVGSGLYFTFLPRDVRDWVEFGDFNFRTPFQLGRYDLASGSLVFLDVPPAKRAVRRGLLCGLGTDRVRTPETNRTVGFGLLLYGMNMCDAGTLRSYVSDGLGGVEEEEPHWEDAYHKIPYADYPDGYYKIDASWESHDLTFGASSYHKRLRRIGLDLTGPIRVIVKNAEGGVWQTELVPTDIRARRLEWLTVDMPYESSFRVRFESIDGHPFRIHNGVDFYIDLNTRN